MSAPVTLCVVNYNGARYLEQTLDAAAAQDPPFAELVLVDNASTDNSHALVDELYPAVRVISLEENHGPGAARNVGLEVAQHDAILFIDNDVALAPQCLATLATALEENENAAVAMPRVLYAYDPEQIQFEGAQCHFLGLLAPVNADTPVASAEQTTKPTGSLITACFLADRRRLGDVAPFDEDFFIYLEDHDFGMRVRCAGWEILSVPGARCFHRGGTEGLSLRLTREYSRTRVVCLIRNRWLILLKNYQVGTLVRLAPVLAAYELFQLAGVLKKGWLVCWIRAAWWTVRHRRETAAKRRQVQESRQVKDKDLFVGGTLPFTQHLATTRVERGGISVLNTAVTEYWKLIKRWL